MSDKQKQWEKQWKWNENAPMYDSLEWLNDHNDFPIFWYRFFEDGEVWYIKQVNKNYGIIYDENYYGFPREKSAVARLSKRSVQKFVDKEVVDYHTMKSWMTLGVTEQENVDEITYIVRPSGGGYIMKFHPVTKKWIQKIHVDENGEVCYRARNLVKQKENHLGVWFEEVEYQNSKGDHWRKLYNEEKKKFEWKKIY